MRPSQGLSRTPTKFFSRNFGWEISFSTISIVDREPVVNKAEPYLLSLGKLTFPIRGDKTPGCFVYDVSGEAPGDL